MTKMSVAATTDYTGGGTKTVSMFRFVTSRPTEFMPEGGKKTSRSLLALKDPKK